MELKTTTQTKTNTKQITTIDLEVFPDYFLFCGVTPSEQEPFIFDIHTCDEKINKSKFINYVKNHITNCNKNNPDNYIMGYNIYDYDIIITLFLYKFLLNNRGKIEPAQIVNLINKVNTVLIKFKDLSDINENVNLYGHIKNYKKLSEGMQELLIKVLSYRNTLSIIDVYRINGWDNKARRASLKWLEASTFSQYILESPYDFNSPISHYAMDGNTEKVKKNIQEYCLYDIQKTRDIARLTKGNIENRIFIHRLFLDRYKNGDYYTLSLVNKILRCNSTQFGYLNILEKLTGFKREKVDKVYQKRREVFPDNEEILLLGSIIKPEIELKNTKDFEFIKNKKVLINTSLGAHTLYESEHDDFENEKLTNYYIRRPNSEEVAIECALGLGGIHGCNPGKYETNEEYVIITFDVASYYPSLVISNKWYPSPLSGEFVKAYLDIKEERFKYPKSHPLNKAYKDTLNSIVGFTKNRFSPCFDYRFFYSVTVNGQLYLINLTENILDKFPDVKVIMLNTDGGELYIKREYKEDIIKAINEFGDRHKLTFEISEYKKIVVSNVNNYVAIKSKEIEEKDINKYEVPIIEEWQQVLDIMKKNNYSCIESYILKDNGKYYYEETKTKGSLYNIKVSVEDMHKNYSAMVIQKAVYNYYVFGIPVVNTIQECNNPFDYIYYIRKNRNNNLYLVNPINNNKESIEKRVIRYYISDYGKLKDLGNNAGYISRINKDDKSSKLHSDNRFVQIIIPEIKEYNLKEDLFKNIKHQYYITQACNIINTLENKTISLF